MISAKLFYIIKMSILIDFTETFSKQNKLGWIFNQETVCNEKTFCDSDVSKAKSDGEDKSILSPHHSWRKLQGLSTMTIVLSE